MVAAALVGTAIVGGVVSSQAAKKGAKAQTQAAETGVAEQRAARESFEARTQPFADIGLEAGKQLRKSLSRPKEAQQFADPTQQIESAFADPTQQLQRDFVDPTQQLQSFLDDPTQQLAEINPIVDFLRQQGFEQIEESAAAGGRLGAGGTLRDLSRFNTQLVSTIVPQLQAQRFGQLSAAAQLQQQQQQREFGRDFSTAQLQQQQQQQEFGREFSTAQIQQQQQQQEFGREFSLENQRFNQLFNVTGLGANVVAGQGTAGLQTATNISNLLVGAGQAQAAGIAGQAAAVTGTLQNIAGIAGGSP